MSATVPAPKPERIAKIKITDGTFSVKQRATATKPRPSRSKEAIAERLAKKAEALKTEAIRNAGKPKHATLVGRKGATRKRSYGMKQDIAEMFRSIDMEAFSAAGADPVMMTLKYVGGDEKRNALAPLDSVVNDHIEYFVDMMSEELGYEVKVLWFKDSNELGCGVHVHMLICPPAELPLKSDVFGATVDACWAISSEQFDLENAFDYETSTGACTWVPTGAAVKTYPTIKDAVEAFAWYEANKKDEVTGMSEPKIAQKQTCKRWLENGNFRNCRCMIGRHRCSRKVPARSRCVIHGCWSCWLFGRGICKRRVSVPRSVTSKRRRSKYRWLHAVWGRRRCSI